MTGKTKAERLDVSSETSIRLRFDDLAADALLTTPQAAEILAVSAHTLGDYRLRGLPPAWLKIGHAVRYRVGTLRDFIRDAETTLPTSVATARRRELILGYDEPPARPGRKTSKW